MANKVNIVVNAQDNASKALGRISDKAKSMRGTFLAVGAAGAAITGALGMFTKNAMEQEIGIRGLEGALKRVGVSYRDNTKAIEGTISALQKKTGIGDEDQRKILMTLINLTGDYETSLQALPVVMDLAAAMGRDATKISMGVARALTGETTALKTYGIEVEKTATKQEVLNALATKFGGAAEDMKDPLEAVSGRLGDLQQQIGIMLLPLMEPFLLKIDDIVENTIAWADKNPALFKTLVVVTGGIGALLISLGILGLTLPPIIAAIGLMTGAWTALTVAMWANPLMGSILIIITAVVFAIGAIVTAIVLLHNNWSKVVTSIKKGFNALVDPINAVISAFNKFSKFNVEALEKFEFTGAVTRQTWSSLEDTLSTTNGTLGEMGEVVEVVADETEKLEEIQHNLILTTKELGGVTGKTLEKMTVRWKDYGLEVSAADDVVVARKMMNYEKTQKENQRALNSLVESTATASSEIVEIIDAETKSHLTAKRWLFDNELKLRQERLDKIKEEAQEEIDIVKGTQDAIKTIHEKIGMDPSAIPTVPKSIYAGQEGQMLPRRLFNVDRTKQLTGAGMEQFRLWGAVTKEGERLGMHAGQLYQDENVGKYFTIVVDPNLTAQLDINASSTSLNDKMGNTPIRWQGNAPLKD